VDPALRHGPPRGFETLRLLAILTLLSLALRNIHAFMPVACVRLR
jgi:hypothetical protein